MDPPPAPPRPRSCPAGRAERDRGGRGPAHTDPRGRRRTSAMPRRAMDGPPARTFIQAPTGRRSRDVRALARRRPSTPWRRACAPNRRGVRREHGAMPSPPAAKSPHRRHGQLAARRSRTRWQRTNAGNRQPRGRSHRRWRVPEGSRERGPRRGDGRRGDGRPTAGRAGPGGLDPQPTRPYCPNVDDDSSRRPPWSTSAERPVARPPSDARPSPPPPRQGRPSTRCTDADPPRMHRGRGTRSVRPGTPGWQRHLVLAVPGVAKPTPAN
jgi:hypothetical protein